MPLKETDETTFLKKRNMVKNPNWKETDQLAIYKAWPRIELKTTEKQIPLVAGWGPWTQDLRIATPAPYS